MLRPSHGRRSTGASSFSCFGPKVPVKKRREIGDDLPERNTAKHRALYLGQKIQFRIQYRHARLERRPKVQFRRYVAKAVLNANFLDNVPPFLEMFQNLFPGGPVVTETMVLLAIRQGNWRHVREAAREIAVKNGDDLMAALAVAAKRGETGDDRAQLLLKLWANNRWRSKT